MPQEEPGGGRVDGTQPRRPLWVSGGVASIGLASFFSDAGHEIATAVLPSFVTGVLRGSAGVLGVIEGLSDALLGVAKLVAGGPANDPTRRVRIARGGYLLTAVFTAAIGLASPLRCGDAVDQGAPRSRCGTFPESWFTTPPATTT